MTAPQTSDLPIKGTKLTPYGWPHMAGAYLGLLYFLAGKKEAQDAFKEATGKDILQAVGFGVSPIDRMIDKATGHDQEVVAAFADWVTEFHWGQDGDEDPDDEIRSEKISLLKDAP